MISEFAIASLVLIALPGPDQALIMRNASSAAGPPACGRCSAA